MSDKSKPRRRRTGSTSARFKPSQLVAPESIRPARVGMFELAAGGAVVIIACALIALVWTIATGAVQEQRTEIRGRTEQALAGQAAVIAETIGHELLSIDQSLAILQDAWKADSETVDLAKSQKQMPALTAVADDLFICDEKHVIKQDILPQAVGQAVGVAYVTFPHGALEQLGSNGTAGRGSLLLQGEMGTSVEARQFPTYIIRPLDHPKGWLIGASYRSTELPKLFADAAIGFDSVVALVDTKRGLLQAVVGEAARRPKTDLSKTDMLGMMNRTPAGTWIGDSGIDGVERMNAFHRVEGRDITVLVAANMAQAMAPAETLAAGARGLAYAATALVIAICALVLWELSSVLGRAREKRVFERNRRELDRLRTEETVNVARARLNAARLQVLLDATTDGIALFDSGLRLVQWNHPFLRGIGVEPRKDMPLDTLLREQAANWEFGTAEDIEVEIARRAGILRAGDVAGLPQPGPDGEILTLRGLPIAEGGFILLLNGLTRWEAAPPPPPSTEIDRPAAPGAAVTALIEW